MPSVFARLIYDVKAALAQKLMSGASGNAHWTSKYVNKKDAVPPWYDYQGSCSVSTVAVTILKMS